MSNEILKLNVGGRRFTTTRTTLTSVPNSALAHMFSPSSGLSLPATDETGAYFLDHAPDYFEAVLEWCRHRRLIVPDSVDLNGLEASADFFGLLEMKIEVMKKRGRRGPFSSEAVNPATVTGEDIPDPICGFEESNLHPLVLRNVSKEYTRPTRLQTYSLPIIMSGRNMVACSSRGAGVLASYLVPVLHRLVREKADSNVGESCQVPQVVILTSCMEISQLIFEEARRLSKNTEIKTVLVKGDDTSIDDQHSLLLLGCNILVTKLYPLLNLLDEDFVSFSDLQVLVLSDADHLTSEDVLDVNKCFEHITMPEMKDLQMLTYIQSSYSDSFWQRIPKLFLPSNALRLTVDGKETSDHVPQSFINVRPDKKADKLKWILSDPQRDQTEKTVIYVHYNKQAEGIGNLLSRENYRVAFVTGNTHPYGQDVTVENFLFDKYKNEKFDILVVTQSVLRGTELKNERVDFVINYDMPMGTDDYIQRIGGGGRSLSFVDIVKDFEIVRDLVPLLKKDPLQHVPLWMWCAGH
jgi:superfamily II DNA/RNA helicase